MNSLAGAAHAWALHYAAEANDEPTLLKLLQSNPCGEKGREFALWGAASGGHLKLTEMILQSGPIENSLRAVEAAVDRGHWELVVRLSEYLGSKGIVLFLPVALKMCRLDAIRGLTTSMIARKDEYGADEWKTKLGDAVLEMARPERLSMLRELLCYPFENHELLKLVNVLAVGISDEVLDVFLKAPALLPLNDRSKAILVLAQKGNWKVASRLLEQGPVAASELEELYALAIAAHRIRIVTENLFAFPVVDEADKRLVLEAQCKALELAVAKGYWKGAKILVEHIGYEARLKPLVNALEQAERSQNSESVQRVLGMMTMSEISAALEAAVKDDQKHKIQAIQRFVASQGSLDDMVRSTVRARHWAALALILKEFPTDSIYAAIYRMTSDDDEGLEFLLDLRGGLDKSSRGALFESAIKNGNWEFAVALLSDEPIDGSDLERGVRLALAGRRDDIARILVNQMRGFSEDFIRETFQYFALTFYVHPHLTLENRMMLVGRAVERGHHPFIRPLLENHQIPTERLIDAILNARDDVTAGELIKYGNLSDEDYAIAMRRAQFIANKAAMTALREARPERRWGAGYTVGGIITASLFLAAAFLMGSNR
jgi:hypothetical protein